MPKGKPRITVWYKIGKSEASERPLIVSTNVEEPYAGIEISNLPPAYELALVLNLKGGKIPLSSLSIYLPSLLEKLSVDNVKLLQRAFNVYVNDQTKSENNSKKK
jgi:hypothetical protein